MRGGAIALAALAACGGGDRPVLAPVIDVPAAGSDAYPYTGVDELVLEIAPAGRDRAVSQQTFAVGEPLALSDIDYGEDLVVHLSGRTSGVEVAYGRTCPVDVSPETVDDEVHLYLSRIVKWAAAPDPTGAAGQLTAYSLPDGSGVFVGAAAVTRFDPAAGAFRPVAIEAIAPREDGMLAALPDGRAFLIGGVDGDDGVPLVEAIDPNPELVSAGPLESQPGPRLRDHAAVTLVDGSVLVVGGRLQPEAGAAFAITRSAWRIRFGDGGVLEEPVQLAVEANAARAGHSVTRLGGEVGADVLIVGGLGSDGTPLAAAELYRPLREAFEPVSGALLFTPRWDHQAVRLPGGSVLVIGGRTFDTGGAEVAATSLELYDPVQGRFTVAGELPSTAGVTEVAIAPMPDGRVLVIGGRDAAGQPVATVLIARLDAVDGRVDLSVTDPLEQPRAGHAAAVLCDGTILVAGGGAGAERYNPPSAGRR